jgi:hypothetical protein
LLLVLGGAIAAGLIVFALLASARWEPLVSCVVLRTNDSLGFPRAFVAITNVSDINYSVRCVAEVFESGKWVEAFRQHTFFNDYRSIAPAEAMIFSIPIPDEPGKWRLKLYCRREPALLTKLLHKLLIKAKFKIDQTPRLVTIDMPP